MSYVAAIKRAVGKSLPKSLLDLLIDNQADFDGRIFTLEGLTLVNGDFESAGADATEASGWTQTEGTGGTITRVDTDAYSGEWSMKFDRTTGGSNYAGDITSDQLPHPEFTTLDLTGWYKSTAELASKITALFYDEDGVSTGSGVLAAATTIQTLWTPIGGNTVTSPAGTRYTAIKVEGATIDVDVAGSAYFDGLELTAGAPNEFNTTGEQSRTGSVAWIDYGTADVWVPDGAATVSVKVQAKASANSCEYRVYIGGNVGTTAATASTSYVTKTSVLTVGSETGAQTVTLEFRHTHVSVGTSYLDAVASGDLTEENIIVA